MQAYQTVGTGFWVRQLEQVVTEVYSLIPQDSFQQQRAAFSSCFHYRWSSSSSLAASWLNALSMLLSLSTDELDQETDGTLQWPFSITNTGQPIVLCLKESLESDEKKTVCRLLTAHAFCCVRHRDSATKNISSCEHVCRFSQTVSPPNRKASSCEWKGQQLKILTTVHQSPRLNFRYDSASELVLNSHHSYSGLDFLLLSFLFCWCTKDSPTSLKPASSTGWLLCNNY